MIALLFGKQKENEERKQKIRELERKNDQLRREKEDAENEAKKAENRAKEAQAIADQWYEKAMATEKELKRLSELVRIGVDRGIINLAELEEAIVKKRAMERQHQKELQKAREYER